LSSSNPLSGIFGKFVAPFKKISGSGNRTEEELVLAVVQRIELEGEEHYAVGAMKDKELLYRRFLRRMDWQVKKAGITVEELVRTFPTNVNAVVAFKSYEGTKGKGESSSIREKMSDAGFKPVQPGVWVLPPTKTPPGLAAQEELRIWFKQQVTKGIPKKVDYVFPFLAFVDLKQVVAERRGVRKMPTAKTVYTVLTTEDVVPSSHLYGVMKERGVSARDIILSGDLSFLCSAFAQREDIQSLQENEAEVAKRLTQATGARVFNLEEIANLGPDSISTALQGIVKHPKDLARRLIIEAQFWMRFLGGNVPA
jgi:hypothetical protein